MIHQFPSELYDSNINSSEKILSVLFCHLLNFSQPPGAADAKDMPETAGFLPTSDTESRRTFFSTRPKYIKAGPSKVRMATSDSNLGPSPEVQVEAWGKGHQEKKNLTRQLAAKGAVSINALARKVAVDEALIGYTSSDPASKYIVIMAWYKSFKRIQGHIPYHWPTQSPKHFHSQQADLPFHQLQPIHDLSHQLPVVDLHRSHHLDEAHLSATLVQDLVLKAISRASNLLDILALTALARGSLQYLANNSYHQPPKHSSLRLESCVQRSW